MARRTCGRGRRRWRPRRRRGASGGPAPRRGRSAVSAGRRAADVSGFGWWDADRVAGGGGGVQCFFVSYTGVDVGWAEWVAWTLEAAGHDALIQAWDFGPGSHFVGGCIGR
ncbi:toll/interleukin-1 receptor domain-containing protein [Frankia sp. AgB32]|uniref:toll/interleukin-1 receptor domain-containing protein n=1 Tax=Frankia sp. AgB32 TaxID=631119 RepID=UPI00200D4FBE|nr:toll/interleukin-1 receptor domain-containing protein [Frankia sp. AgB32]MCK9898327.1 toll/interleukin-1 receptor domain-containing protein [Frankia sp. AgB32]